MLSRLRGELANKEKTTSETKTLGNTRAHRLHVKGGEGNRGRKKKVEQAGIKSFCEKQIS